MPCPYISYGVFHPQHNAVFPRLLLLHSQLIHSNVTIQIRY